MFKKVLSARSTYPTIKLALTKYRPFLRGTYLEYVCIAIVFILLTCFYTNFIVLHITHQLFVDGPGDATAGFLWLNYADHGLNPFLPVSHLVNYPYGEQLGGATFITYLALWLPIRLLSFVFGPVAGLNIMMFSGFVGGAVGGYWTLKRLTGSVLVALFAGLAIAFVPYNLYKSSAHLAYIFSLVFVLMLASFMALWLRPTKLRAVLFAASVALAFYTDGYYLLIATVMTFGLVIAGILYGAIRRFLWVEYRQRIITLLISLGSLLLLMVPIGYVQLSQGDNVQRALNSSRSNISDEIHAYQSKAMDFIIPSPTNPLFKLTGSADTIDTYKNLRSNRTENMTYVGFVIITLVCVGLVTCFVWLFFPKHSSLRALDSRIVNSYVLLAIITVTTTPLFLAFMLSPSVTIHGHSIPLPGQFFIDHNIALWRVMSRFFVPLHVVLVLFGAFTLWIVTMLPKMRARIYLKRGIVGLAIVLLLGEYATGIYRPSFDFNSAPEAYHWLAHQKGISTIAEFPMVDPLDAHTTRYLTYQVVHGKNLINFKEPNDKRLTNTLGSIANPEAINFAYQRGAQLVVTHDINCTDVDWGRLVHSSNDTPKGKICMYTLNNPPSPDGLFILYEDGFKYYPNLPREDTSLASFDSLKATLKISGKAFTERETGLARLTASIRDFHNDKVNGEWKLLQDGEIISRGIIESSSSSVDVVIDASKPVVFELQPSAGSLLRSNDLSLNNAIITSLLDQ